MNKIIEKIKTFFSSLKEKMPKSKMDESKKENIPVVVSAVLFSLVFINLKYYNVMDFCGDDNTVVKLKYQL